MHTRSSGPVVEPSSTLRRRRKQKRSQQQVHPTIVKEKPVVTMADTRTMAELLRAPTEGDAEAIVVPPIPAEHFKLKHSLMNLFKKEPPHSRETWDDLVSKFINKFFPPSKTTNLHNEISNFQQRFDEPFYETWDRFKDLLRACPHYGFTELHQLDTFYNSLNPTDQDSLNSAGGGLSPDVVARTNAVKALLLKNTTPPPASVKAVKETAVNYNQGNAGHCPPSIAHQVRPPDFPPVHNNQNRGNNYNPGNLTYRALTPPTAPSNKLANYKKVNETSMRAMQNQINNMTTELRNEFQAIMLQQNNKLENMLSNYFQMNKPSGSGSSPLPNNTVNNPKGDLKAITTQSGVSYDGPPIPPPFSPSPKVVEREPEVTKDLVQSSAEKVQPPDVQPQAPTSESIDTRKPKQNIPYPSRHNNQKLRERDDHQMKKFLQIFRSLHFNLSFSDALLYMPKFASTFKNLLSIYKFSPLYIKYI
ncbi:reverse transcriptase domain-containing protein [Tanacetum coccineum]|uniref:Reverse transcriptase domain-containing protein n=1 Tax=Tanacetum coccineum TaxID=301880 RepID=A0ABQ5FJQ4_9ASTR